MVRVTRTTHSRNAWSSRLASILRIRRIRVRGGARGRAPSGVHEWACTSGQSHATRPTLCGHIPHSSCQSRGIATMAPRRHLWLALMSCLMCRGGRAAEHRFDVFREIQERAVPRICTAQLWAKARARASGGGIGNQMLELATLGVAALLTERRIVLDVPFMSHAFEAPFADGWNKTSLPLHSSQSSNLQNKPALWSRCANEKSPPVLAVKAMWGYQLHCKIRGSAHRARYLELFGKDATHWEVLSLTLGWLLHRPTAAFTDASNQFLARILAKCARGSSTVGSMTQLRTFIEVNAYGVFKKHRADADGCFRQFARGATGTCMLITSDDPFAEQRFQNISRDFGVASALPPAELGTVRKHNVTHKPTSVSGKSWRSWHTAGLFDKTAMQNLTRHQWQEVLSSESLQTWFALGEVCGGTTAGLEAPYCLTSWTTFAMTGVARTAALSSKRATAMLSSMRIFDVQNFTCRSLTQSERHVSFHRNGPICHLQASDGGPRGTGMTIT